MNTEVSHRECICYKCKTQFWLPDELYKAAKHSEKIPFWCPYGHEQIFKYKPPEAAIETPPPPKELPTQESTKTLNFFANIIPFKPKRPK